MDKEYFLKEIDKIDFPKNDVSNAISSGITKGKNYRSYNKKSIYKLIGSISTIAATALLASGFIFAPVTKAFASIPIIGPFYDEHSLQIGYKLQESNLITKIDQKASCKGIDITITSAYYDGAIIGITFKAEGKRVSLAKTGDQGPESGYNFHLGEGKEQLQWSSTMTKLKKSNKGYTAAIEFYNPKASLPTNYTLPITFDYVTGVKGTWKFNVPVKQLPLKTITMAEKSILQGDDSYSVKMESIEQGKATTILKYTTTTPLVGKDDEMEIFLYDKNEDHLIAYSQASVLSTKIKNGLVEKETREVFSGNVGDEFIIKPVISKHELPAIASLTLNTPFEVKSNRFNYNIQVNRIEKTGNNVIIDYNINGIAKNQFKKDIIENFAESIQLIKQNNIHLDKDGNIDMNKSLGYLIHSVKTKEINDKNLHFQSIFKTNESFNLDNYSLVIPFETFSLNNLLDMEPLRIDLN